MAITSTMAQLNFFNKYWRFNVFCTSWWTNPLFWNSSPYDSTAPSAFVYIQTDLKINICLYIEHAVWWFGKHVWLFHLFYIYYLFIHLLLWSTISVSCYRHLQISSSYHVLLLVLLICSSHHICSRNFLILNLYIYETFHHTQSFFMCASQKKLVYSTYI